MMVVHLFVVALFFNVARVYGSFNAEELSSVFYDVDILGEPKLSTEMVPSPTSMLLLSKHGQRYECQLPANAHTLGDLGTSSNVKDSEKKSQEAVPELKTNLVGIPRLLDDMAETECLRLNKGWWEYEFCFRKQIRQFHVNDQSGAIENESILGEFVSDFDWSKVNLEATGGQSAEGRPVRLHSQAYAGGSTCDLTGLPRRAEVQFHCDPTPHAGDALVDVEEPSSCVYRLTVRTGRLCAHPLLRKAAEEQIPSRRRPPESIQCRPLLEPESMDRYEKAQAAKRLAASKAEELAKLRRIQRQNPLRRLARIRHVLSGHLGGPLRRRKLAQLALRRRQRLQRQMAATEKSVEAAENILDSAKLISRRTEASLKALTKRLKAKLAAKGGSAEKAVDDADAKSIKSALASLPEALRQKLTSRRGIESLRSGIGAQFEQILQDAQREVGGGGAGAREPDILARMSVMLDKILNQVDDAGRKLDEERKRIEAETLRYKSTLVKGENKAVKSKSSDTTSSKSASATEKTAEAKVPPPEGDIKPEGKKMRERKLGPPVLDTKTSKKERRAKLSGEISKTAKPGAEAKDEEAEGSISMSSQEMEKLRGRLEAGIREKMERRGIETNGLTLHLMTVGSRGGEGDEDGKSKSFVGIIILKNDRQQQEQERMRRLEDNYNFRMDETPKL